MRNSAHYGPIASNGGGAYNNLFARWRAKDGYGNLVNGSPFGDLTELGGAVSTNATAGPNGGPAWRFNAASGGQLISTAALAFQPHHVLFVARVRTPVSGKTIMGSAGAASSGHSVDLVGTDKLRMNATSGLDTPGSTDLTQWHVYDQYWHSFSASNAVGQMGSKTRVDGAAYTVSGNDAVPYPGLQSANGICLGGKSDGSNRLDVDIAEVIWHDGLISYAKLLQYLAYFQSEYGLTIAAPASYSDPLVAPRISAPTLWTPTSPWDFIILYGQSNMVGRAPDATEAFGPNIYALTKGWKWSVAAYPLEGNSLIKDPVGSDGLAAFGLQGALANTIQQWRGLPLVLVPAAESGTSASPSNGLGMSAANKGNRQRSHLYGQMIARAKECLYYGGTCLGMFFMQGEADISQADQWPGWVQSLVNATRSDLNLPNMPFVYGQLDTSLASNNPLANVYQPTLQSDTQLMVPYVSRTVSGNYRADNLHLTSVGYNTQGRRLGNAWIDRFGGRAIQASASASPIVIAPSAGVVVNDSSQPHQFLSNQVDVWYADQGIDQSDGAGRVRSWAGVLSGTLASNTTNIAQQPEWAIDPVIGRYVVKGRRSKLYTLITTVDLPAPTTTPWYLWFVVSQQVFTAAQKLCFGASNVATIESTTPSPDVRAINGTGSTVKVMNLGSYYLIEMACVGSASDRFRVGTVESVAALGNSNPGALRLFASDALGSNGGDFWIAAWGAGLGADMSGTEKTNLRAWAQGLGALA